MTTKDNNTPDESGFDLEEYARSVCGYYDVVALRENAEKISPGGDLSFYLGVKKGYHKGHAQGRSEVVDKILAAWIDEYGDEDKYLIERIIERVAIESQLAGGSGNFNNNGE